MLVSRKMQAGQQRRHAEFGNRREHRLHGGKLRRALGGAREPLGQLGGDLIAQGVRNDDERAGVFACRADVAPVEVALLVAFGNVAEGREILRGELCPACRQLMQEPVLIQSLDVLSRVLEAVVEAVVAVRERLAKGMVEPAVIGVHAVEFVRVGVPERTRLGKMEACAVLFAEKLHLPDEEQAVEVVLEPVVPACRAAVFADGEDKVGADDLLGDLAEQLRQQALVHAGENVAGDEGFGFEPVEPLREVKLVLDRAADVEKRLVILAAAPLMHEAVTVRLVALGEKTLKTLEDRGVHGLGERGQQEVGSEVGERPVLLVEVAGILVRKFPERRETAEFADVQQDFVAFLVEPGGEHGDETVLHRCRYGGRGACRRSGRGGGAFFGAPRFRGTSRRA